MKHLLFALIFILTCSFANAQTERSNLAVAKFVQFYKADQADSIYAMFSSQMKTAVNLEGTRQLISTIKSQLGGIVKSHYAGSPGDQVYGYLLKFQRPLVDIALTIQDDETAMIAGIMQKAVEVDKNDPVEAESPDNISVTTTSGTIYGTLLLPDTTKIKGKIPVVLLIAGSGPTDRNMNQGMALRSNSFLMLARALADNGIASVRYDKRSVGKSISTQTQEELKLEDYIDDADLFVNLLKTDKRFSKVIVAGHSEGATIGVLTSLQTNPAAYISLSGASTDIGTVLRKQLKARASTADYKIATEVLDSLKAGKLFHSQVPQTLAPIFMLPVQPFLISSMKYNASVQLAKLKIPILIIGGTTDLQISVDDAKLLAKANPKAKLTIISGMNHVLKSAPLNGEQNRKTYNSPDLPLHPGLAPALIGFIKQIN